MQLPENPSFSNIFHLLFPLNLFEEIKSQSNKYARETTKSLQRRDRLAQTSCFRSWPENGVTSGEIKAFLALLIAMGLARRTCEITGPLARFYLLCFSPKLCQETNL